MDQKEKTMELIEKNIRFAYRIRKRRKMGVRARGYE